ncbi:MAG: hypothetical protein K6F37_09220 [Lachnospiraceae bacterium]|nr:hypothetical protein [Lachnospiraceae bacterium]
MSIERRLFLCRLINEMELNEACCRKIGIINKSTFRGKAVDEVNGGKEKCF